MNKKDAGGQAEDTGEQRALEGRCRQIPRTDKDSILGSRFLPWLPSVDYNLDSYSITIWTHFLKPQVNERDLVLNIG